MNKLQYIMYKTMQKITPISFLLLLLGFYSNPLSAQNNGGQSYCDTIIIHSNNENEFDVTLYDADPFNNFSTDPNFIAEGWTIGGSPIVLRALFKFPLPILPPGSIIDSAKMYLSYNNTTTHLQGNSFYPGSAYGNPNDATLYRVIQTWNPLGVNWNNQPAFTNTNAVWVPPTNAQTQGLDINITPLINDSYLYPNNSFGFLFKQNTENPYRCQVYASSNHANPALHPKLVICYSTTTSNGINDISNTTSIRITCLPQGQIRLVNPLHCMLNEIAIYSMDGSMIDRIPLFHSGEQQTIQVLHSLQRGLYIVRLSTSEGTISKKMPVW